jgi:hypothetical protein
LWRDEYAAHPLRRASSDVGRARELAVCYLGIMDEQDFLSRVLYATDQQNRHAGVGLPIEHTYAADTYAWISRAEKSGHVRVSNGRATITDEGRQRLAQLIGKPLYPIPKFPRD